MENFFDVFAKRIGLTVFSIITLIISTITILFFQKLEFNSASEFFLSMIEEGSVTSISLIINTFSLIGSTFLSFLWGKEIFLLFKSYIEGYYDYDDGWKVELTVSIIMMIIFIAIFGFIASYILSKLLVVVLILGLTILFFSSRK